ncbi:F-box domain-containing protein [Mycena kentingensis (nom. inval.)]|nr:F-box domain-containing protein [Mycena kentingensis (nom. inval.)]
MNQTTADLRREIYLLEREIDRQAATLSANRSHLHNLQANLRERNSMFPIHALPPEIIAEVFVHCLPEETSLANYSCAPFVLLRVCKAWKQIAMSTAALWTNINILLSVYNEESPVQTLECMAQRSSEMPLTVAIMDYATAAMEPFCRISLPYENITELVADSYYTDELIRLLRDLPNLLVFRYTQRLGGTARPTPASLVHRRLREVHLSEIYGVPVLQYLTLPSLETLVFNESMMDWEVLDDFLARSKPPLHRLAFHPGRKRTVTLPHAQTWSWTPQLTELELAYPSRGHLEVSCARLSSAASLPKLRILVLRCRQSAPSSYRQDLQDEVGLSEVVECVLEMMGKRIDDGDPAHPFEIRVIAEDTDGVGLVSLSDAQKAECRKIKSCGFNIWIGPEQRNMAA